MPTSMSCGLPISVIALPTLAPVTSAIRYGTGFRRARSVARRTIGVKSRQIVSLTKSAERRPELTTSSTSIRRGVPERRRIHADTYSKNRASFR